MGVLDLVGHRVVRNNDIACHYQVSSNRRGGGGFKASNKREKSAGALGIVSLLGEREGEAHGGQIAPRCLFAIKGVPVVRSETTKGRGVGRVAVEGVA